MSLKKNFYQALSELLNGERPAESAGESGATVPPDSRQAEPAASAASAASSSSSSRPEETAQKEASSAGTGWRRPFQREPFGQKQETPPTGSAPTSNEVTIISRNTIVLGDIRSLASVNIEGSVQGRVEVLKDATIQGMLVGDLACKSVRLEGSSVQGNVLSKEEAYIDQNSTMLGDLKTQNASIDGRLKGNIEASGKTSLGENAIVAGDIHSTTISVADGAHIKGFVSTAYLAEHGDSAFPSQIVISDENLLSGIH